MFLRRMLDGTLELGRSVLIVDEVGTGVSVV